MAVHQIFAHAQRTPDRVAVICNTLSYSYAEFAAAIETARQFLESYALTPGSVGAISVANMLDGWVLLFALRSLGLTTVAVRSRAELTALNLSNVSCLVLGETAESARRVDPNSKSPWPLIRAPANLLQNAAQGPQTELESGGVALGGHIMMTSGTTGVYKKVLRDATTEALAIPLHAQMNGIRAESMVYVVHFPLWTAGGYRWPLITWSVGGTVVIHQTPDLHQPLNAHALTHFFATPEVVGDVIDAGEGSLRRNDTTRLLVTGGTLSSALLRRAQQHVTRQVFAVYASTEVLTVATTLVEDPEDLLWHRIDPSREVQIVNEAGAVLAPGQVGFVRIRIIDDLDGYLDDDDATRAFFKDGYFYSGDMGLLGNDGRLSLQGRASDVVNVLGHKVATRPIEQAIQDRLGAKGVCILTVPNETGGEDFYLVIQPGQRIEKGAVQAAAEAEFGVLAKAPMDVVFLDTLPRNDMGKILRQALKETLRRKRNAGAT